MAKTKIKADEHGLFIRTGGYLFRPEMTDYAHVCEINNFGAGFKSKFVEGQEVKVHHMGGTPHATVKTDTEEEWWNNHGQYLGMGPSTEQWDPVEDEQKE